MTAFRIACAFYLCSIILGQKALCQQPPDTAESHLGKGYDALRHEQYDVAAAEFRSALQLDSTLVMRARFPLGVALFELKQSAEARREFETVRRQAGDHPNISYYLGRLDLADQDFPSAIRNLNQAVAHPPFPDTAYYLGLSYLRQGDLASAEKWLKFAAQTNPRDSLSAYQLGLLYRKEGREQEAKKALELSANLRRKDDEESKIRMECAQRLDQGPREEARAFCQQLYDPHDAEKLATLGTIYGEHGDLEAALDPLRRAAELAPQSPQMQYNLAFTYCRMNRFEDARMPLARAVERWPDVFPLNSLYGTVLLKLGESVMAAEVLRRAHQLNLQDSAVANQLYTALLAAGRTYKASRAYPDAVRSLDEAVSLRPAESEPHDLLAETYRLAGRLSDASAERQKADRLR